MRKLFLLIQLLAVYTTLLSQAVGINTDGSVPHPSSILDIKSSTKGLLIPRTSTTTRQSILSGANGLMLYDTTIGSFWFMNGGVWLESGRMDLVNSNTFFGYQSGRLFPVGDFNTGFGIETFYNNTTGLGNTSLGASAMHSNTTGNNNMSAGMFSLYFNTTGSSNTAIGNNAMILNQTGFSNTAIGNGSLFHNTSGSNLVAVGDSALFNTTTGYSNTALGSKALYFTSTGYNNTALGFRSGYSNNTGNRNVFVGDSSGYVNTSGFANVFVGNRAGVANITGGANTMVGERAGSVSTGDGNTFFGGGAGGETTTGSFNCFIGRLSGNMNIGGSYNTLLGNNSDMTTYSSLSYATALGYGANVGCSNCLVLGGNNTTSRTRVGINTDVPETDLHIKQQGILSLDNSRGIRLEAPNGNHWRVFLDPGYNYVFQYNNGQYCYIERASGDFINPSDARLKKDIYALPSVLDKVLLLEPKTYHYISSNNDDRFSYGFLAQEVEKLFPDFVFSGEDGKKGIGYRNFSVIAIKAIQEQQQVIEEQKQKLDVQQQQIQEILKELSYLRKKIDQ